MPELRRLPTAAAALLLAACAAAGAHVETTPLGGEDLALRARLLAMADARRPDSALLDGALALGRPSALRAAAALGAGQVGARTFAPRLRVLVADGDTAVGASAAFALGLLRDTASVDALAAIVVEGGQVAREAAWSLGEIGAPARGAITVLLLAASPAGARVDDALILDVRRVG